MKHQVIILPLFLCMVSACICSSDPKCRADTTQITFENYQPSELDSILVQVYYAGTGFNDLRSEYTVQASLYDTTALKSLIGINLSIRNEYRLTVLSDGNTFDITDLSFIENKSRDKIGCLGYTKELTTIQCPFATMSTTGKAMVLEDGSIELTK